MAWEARHFNFGVGEESAYLIKQPEKKSNSLYSLFSYLLKKPTKNKKSLSKEKIVKGQRQIILKTRVK